MNEKILTYFSSITLCLLILSVFLLVSVSALPATNTWTKTTLSSSSGARGADAEVHTDGSIHFVYIQSSAGYDQVYYNHISSSGILGSPTQLSSSSSLLNIKICPRIALGPGGNLNVVWEEISPSNQYKTIYMRQKPNPGSWGSIVTLRSSSTDGTVRPSFPDIAVNKNNQFAIVYTREYYLQGYNDPYGSEVYMVDTRGASYDIPINQGYTSTGSSFAPRAVFDEQYLHIAYNFKWDPDGTFNFPGWMVMYRNFNFLTSSWGNPIRVAGDASGTVDSAMWPDIAVSSSGGPVFCYWKQGAYAVQQFWGDLYVRIGAGSNSRIYKVNPGTADVDYINFVDYAHSVNARPNGNVLVAYCAGSSNAVLYCNEYDSYGELDNKRVLSSSGQYRPVMLVDNEANAMIMYDGGGLYLVEEPQPVLKVATPTLNPPGGFFTNTQDVIISCDTSSVTIRYTTDGSDPTSTHGTAISSGQTITLSSTTTLKAIAYRTGYIDSDVASETYTKTTIVPKVDDPIFSPGGGTYPSAQSVTILYESGATLRYTTDGSEPTSTHGTIYSGAISVSSSMTIKAIAYRTGYIAGYATATYTIGTSSDTTPPTCSIIINNDDSTTSSTTVTLSVTYADADSGVKRVRYSDSTSGWGDEVWDENPPNSPYTVDFTFSDSTPGIKYVSIQVEDNAGNLADDWDQIELIDQTNPDTTPPTGSIVINNGDATTSSATVSATCTYADAQSGVKRVRYSEATTGWSDEPWDYNPPDSPYTIEFTFTDSTPGTKYLSYQIEDNAGNQFDVWDQIELIEDIPAEQVDTPTISPPGDTYTSEQTVTISCTTSDAEIRYTTDGSEPTSTHGTTISSGETITVSSSKTIKAIAYKSGYTDSNVATATYTIADVNELSFPVNVNDIDYFVETRSSSSVYGLSFNQALKRLRFSVNGPDGTKGFCDITIPAELMSGDFSLYIDNVELVEGVDYTKTFGGVNYLFSVSYDHSSHVIDVFSTNVIPDFAGWMFLPFLMSATLLGIILRKRLKKQ
jgi:hypothetical protein